MRRFLGVSAAAVALAVLAGCSGSSGSASSGAGTAAGGQAAVAPPTAPGSSSLPADSNREVVSTATASVVVKDPAVGAQRISALAESAGGRVDKRVEQAGSGKDGVDGASADLVVRVPAEKLTGFLAHLDDLGDVESLSVSHTDVTASAVDLDARISALQTSVTRLQGLMSQAASTADLLTAEKALSDRQAQLESLQSQRALLADQVQLSTLDVHLRPVGLAPAGGPTSFLGALSTGWRALLVTLRAIGIALGVLLPWLALGAVVGAAVLAAIRRVRRRPAVAAPTPPVPPQN
jgi:hypothetical protein